MLTPVLPLIGGHIVYDLLAATEQRSPAQHHTPALALLVALAVLGSALLAGSTARHLATRSATNGDLTG